MTREETINIAEILKDKPQGTKLYSPAFGECTLYLAECLNVLDRDKIKHSFMGSGKLQRFGEVMLFPSKSMQDWSKFIWKRGDVLTDTTSEYCIGVFDKWTSDDYSTFSAKYINVGTSDNFTNSYTCKTKEWEKVEHSEIYISKIEKIMNGKLNLSTLEIQHEFNDGDIIHIGGVYNHILILKKIEDSLVYYYAMRARDGHIVIDGYIVDYNNHILSSRLATYSEKQQLFEALAKENKRWDTEKRQIVDLEPKWVPKPFDKVITKLDDDAIWTANIFSHKDCHGEYVTIGCEGGYPYCLPYNEETAKLVGTTNEWKGDNE